MRALATICQATVAAEINDENVFDMLMFADDRQLADLRTACLKHVQRRWNADLCAWWEKSGDGTLPGLDAAMAGTLPGLDAAMAAPSLKSDVDRALRGI